MITGIDIGGSHITVGIVDKSAFSLQDGCVRKKINSHAPADEILDGWCDAIQTLWQTKNISTTPLAFAMPGPFDYKQGISLIKGYDKYEALYELNIRDILSARLNIDPSAILFRNDAEAFIAGECKAGAGMGFRNAVALTLGTGLGSAVYHNGAAKDAELSFRVLKEGASIETYISTRGLLRNYFNLTGTKVANVLEMLGHGREDIFVRRAFQQFSDDLTVLLERFITDEQPEVVIIGGNIAEAWELFMPAVMRSVGARLPALPQFAKALLGEQAAIIGATLLFEYR